jgi:hypothetical protein
LGPKKDAIEFKNDSCHQSPSSVVLASLNRKKHDSRHTRVISLLET